MTFGGYLAGTILLAIAIVPLAAASVRVRARLVPAWSGPVARLAEIAITLALLLGVLHAVGAVGQFQRMVIAGVGAVLGAVLFAGLGRRPATVGSESVVEAPRPTPRWALGGVALLATVVVAQFSSRVLETLDRGIVDYDSLTYHLPQAARFADTGWITRLHFANPEFPNMFHPVDTELLHALGMEMYGRDFASPLLNAGWFALALFAAWCVGRPFGVAPITTAGAVAMLASPQMAALQPGAALSDLASVTLLVVAAAFLVQPARGSGAFALAGAAGGMAIGTKLTVLAPVGVLTLAVPFLVSRGRRGAVFAAWTVPLIATGSFWYVRNLVRAGSPIPSLALGIGPLPFSEPQFEKLEIGGFSVAHYLTDLDVWRDWFRPGLDAGLGPGWWLLGLAAAAGLVITLVRGDAVRRVLALAGVASILSWMVTPVSAFGPEGMPALFSANIRYAFVGVAFALVVTPTLEFLRSSRWQAALLGSAALLVATSQLSDEGSFTAWADTRRPAAAAGAMVLLAGVVATALAVRRLDRSWLAACGAAAVLVGVLGGYAVQRHYVDHRYAQTQSLAWLAEVDGARIGFVGTDLGYQLYGAELDNWVQYVGERGPDGEFHVIETCAAWREALAEGRYEYVSHWFTPQYPEHPQEEWTRTDAAAREFFRSETQVVYRIEGTPDPATCPPA